MATMDFFGHQDRARRASKWLVVWFVLAVLGIVACVHFAVAISFGVASKGDAMWRPEVLALTVGSTVALVTLASLFKISQLRGGGPAVAKMLGGRQVDPSTRDAKERMFLNIVEEMSIASGTPMPSVFVLDDEKGINAFAAGWSPSDAAVAMTRGALEAFDRDEMQGVVAHEFSHIFHGDMRLNIRIMGVLFGIVCIATIGRFLLRVTGRSSGDSKKGAAAFLVFGLLLLVIGGIGVLFSRLIQAAISRQREYLADASAVQYTRNPRGIGMALAKIGGRGGKLESAQAEAASHFLFADGVSRMFGAGFATHPPIQERIERILPGFKKRLGGDRLLTNAVAAMPAPQVAGVAGLAGGGSPSAIVAAVGTIAAPQLAAAQTLLRELPLELHAAARDPRLAQALSLALLLDAEMVQRKAQLDRLAAEDAHLAHEAAMLHDHLARSSRRVRLPLLELAIGALRGASADEIKTLRRRARDLAEADGRLSPFEFALLSSLERHLRLADQPPPRPLGRPDSLLQHRDSLAVVLGVMARAGADDDVAAARAFARAVAVLGSAAAPSMPPTLPPLEATRTERLAAAVDALARVSPLGKRNLLAACAEAVGDDGVVRDDEYDLLRAIAEAWDCPLPIVTGAVATGATS
ncbi:MAG: hypothetical protein RL398_834 [Planctomycetota bacterium]